MIPFRFGKFSSDPDQLPTTLKRLNQKTPLD